MRYYFGGLICVVAAICSSSSAGSPAPVWAPAALPDEAPVVGPLRDDRTVAMFYFLWSCESGETDKRGPTDVSEVLSKYPEAASNPKHPVWGKTNFGVAGVEWGANHHYHHWGKPLLGYYCSRDRWVVARHVRLLSQAGIDLLVLDATNSLVYEPVVDILISELRAATAQGVKTPKLVFYTNSKSGETMEAVWRAYYDPKSSRYAPDMFFPLDGKPLIIGRAEEALPMLRQSLTIRESQWPNEPDRDCGWPWMEFVRPQPLRHCNGQPEIVNVSVAQHSETVKMSTHPFEGQDKNWGRGYHNGIRDHSADAIARGANFEEQWQVALKLDPPIIFVTGWNEWIAARFEDGKGGHFMVDLATPEFSRDIEPMDGGWGDSYYLQLVRNIRRYKGAPPDQELGCFRGLTSEQIYFRDYRGDTVDREAPGVGGQMLNDNSGRNDIVASTIRCHNGALQISAETAAPLTLPSGGEWMQLDLAAEPVAGPAARYRVQFQGAGRNLRGMLFQLNPDGSQRRAGTVDASRSVTSVSVTLPTKRLARGTPLRAVRFKWSDNVRPGDPLNVYRSGDTAPEGGLEYRVRLPKT